MRKAFALLALLCLVMVAFAAPIQAEPVNGGLYSTFPLSTTCHGQK